PYFSVLFTVQNTDSKCFWLTNWVETVLVQCWYPTTVATTSRAQKQIIAQYLSETADSLEGLPFKLHDFGFRGSTSVESDIGGAANLVNFCGTDTIAGIVMARNYYGCEMGGFSVPAAEHSTITTWGKDGEVDAFRNMLLKVCVTLIITLPSAPITVLPRPYNSANTPLYITEPLHSYNSTLVVRPDSGDPPKVVVKVLNLLGKAFGTVKNSKGFHLLPPYIRIIQGDGISYETLGTILENMKRNKWSADNISFGSGGALLQKMDRDTQKFAYKCSYAVVNGKGVNVFKQPITDLGKKSKKGLLSLELDDQGNYCTVQEGKGDPDKVSTPISYYLQLML
ncbi:predicted protein, partial [Nematostella vectensis]